MVFLKFHAVGAEPILEAVSLFHVFLQVECKGGRLVPLEEIPENLQARPNIQFPAYGGKLGKVSNEVGTHTGEIGAGFVDVPLGHRDGDAAVLHHAVAHAGHLGEQHFIVLFPVMVQPILPHGQQQGFLKFLFVDLSVVDGDFGGSAGVQRVQQLRVVEEHRRLIFLAGDLIVDVGKGEGFGEPAPHLKNPIRPDALDGDGVLYGLWYGEFLFFCFRCFTERFDDRHPSFQCEK